MLAVAERGNAAALPADAFDLYQDGTVAEPLPLDPSGGRAWASSSTSAQRKPTALSRSLPTASRTERATGRDLGR
ncbi:hypothetical protein [Pseudofulvimonas gallinarii]|uniref:hypothetical protein n=1 Tax=Pseudofulvimonas gallinarii TaxID=634155 RepID=UPI00109EEFA3|nr:hypothetical protein [Pseudofulvimonas gallinarii]